MKKLNVGIVGLGVLCKQGEGYGGILSIYPHTKVNAICDINREVLEKNGKVLGLSDKQIFTKYEDFLNSDIDIVFIGTPIPFHSEQAVKAMEAGKHVLSEVTASNTVEGCVKILEAQRKTKKIYMMAENYVYYQFIRQWKEIAAKGRLGKIYYAEGEYVHSIRNMVVDEKGNVYWRANRAPIHYCSHNLGPLLTIMDDRIVKATGSGKGVNIIKNVGVGAIDMQVALFETLKGATIKLLRSSVATREPGIVYYSVYGTKGCLELGRNDNPGISYFEGEDKEAKKIGWEWHDPGVPKEYVKGHGTSEYFLIKDFIDSIINDTKPPIDVVRALDFTLPGIIAQEAIMKGNVWLDVPHFE